jgi:hypothetical protein
MLGMPVPAVMALLIATGIAGFGRGTKNSDAAPPPTTTMTIVGTSLRASDGKIYVNTACEVFPRLTLPFTDHKPKGEWIPTVCHLEKVGHSERTEEKPAGGEALPVQVEIREEDVVLQNITVKPVVFAVVARVPEGWSLDSNPKPVTVAGTVAIFEVHAGPWETVRLHVGMRHARDLKPKD